MRFYERQPGESTRAWEAFKTYRDLGEGRSIDAAYRLFGGHQGSKKRASGRWRKWCVEHDWVDRARAYDDYHEIIRREAIEVHERKRATNKAAREAEVQDRLLAVKEKLVERLATMAMWPLERREIVSEDGTEITRIYPSRWSFHTLVKAVEVLDDAPDKIALRDPSGSREYGADPDDIRQRFLDLILEVSQEEEEERSGE